MSSPIKPATQTLQMRCGACRHIFDGVMLVGVPVQQAVASMRANACPACGNTKKLLLGQSRSKSEDDIQRQVVATASLQARIQDWETTGEIANSAKTICRHMSARHQPGTPSKDASHPHDASDLHRCMLLLRRIPEWLPRMPEMAVHSPAWRVLGEDWPQITAVFNEEAGANWDLWPRPRTGELIKKALAA